MDQNLFSGTSLTPQEKRDNLESAAFDVEMQNYHKPLTDEEAAKYKHDLTQAAIKKAALEEEFKSVAKGYKEKIKPVAEKFAEYLSIVKHNGIPTEGKIYLIADHAAGMMGSYDEAGTLLSMRRLLPEERQENLFAHNLKLQSNG